MRLIICRHSIRECTTESDCSISAEGVTLINNRMEEIKSYIKGEVTTILTSPYKRTIETSYCISNNLINKPIISICMELRETVFNSNQIDKLPISLRELINTDNKFDTWDTIYDRAKQFLDNITILNNNTIFAVTHGAPINAIIKTVLPTYTFDDTNANPTTYVPKYFDYAVLEYDFQNEKWQIIYKNFS